MPGDAGSPELTLRYALAALGDSDLRVDAASSLYRTPCVPAGHGPEYVNAAACLSGADTAAALLAILHRIETRFGRAREERWGRRTLDLDLLDFGGQVLPDRDTYIAWRDLPPAEQVRRTPDGLILPHPRLQDRCFVLVPLVEIAPDWVHPVTGRTAAQLLAARPEDERRAIKLL